MKKIFLLLSVVVLLGCQQGFTSLNTIFSLPKKLKEVSGLTYDSNSKLLWALEDHGNANEIYGINLKGKIEKTITIAKRSPT